MKPLLNDFGDQWQKQLYVRRMKLAQSDTSFRVNKNDVNDTTKLS